MAEALQDISCPACGNTAWANYDSKKGHSASCSNCEWDGEDYDRITEYVAYVKAEIVVRYVWDEESEEYVPHVESVEIPANAKIEREEANEGRILLFRKPDNEADITLESVKISTVIDRRNE